MYVCTYGVSVLCIRIRSYSSIILFIVFGPPTDQGTKIRYVRIRILVSSRQQSCMYVSVRICNYPMYTHPTKHESHLMAKGGGSYSIWILWPVESEPNFKIRMVEVQWHKDFSLLYSRYISYVCVKDLLDKIPVIY